MDKRYVVAVAAPIGGGKTSLVKAIAADLGDATTIHFDSYETITQKPIDEIIRWIERGAEISELSVTNMASDLTRLKQGEKVTDPLSHKEVPSGKYILFEMPLGREHGETAELIDLLIWVEVPLDIALARKIREFTIDFLAHPGAVDWRDFAEWVKGYIENYLKFVRRVLQIQQERVKPGADIVLDGESDFETIVSRATSGILSRIP